MTQPVAVTAIVAWIWAGMFAQLLQDGGFVGGLVWLADSAGVGAALFPAITFVLAAVFTTGIGTGYGATVAFVGLFFPAGVLLGANPVLLFGAILSGAIFGDNLAPVSDTTIVSAVTQDADIGGVVASRFKLHHHRRDRRLPRLRRRWRSDGRPRYRRRSADDLPRGKRSDRPDSRRLDAGRDRRGHRRPPHRRGHLVGIVIAVAFNLIFGLEGLGGIVMFNAPPDAPLAEPLSGLPILTVVEDPDAVGVGGSLMNGVAGFLELSILVLLIIGAAQIMIRGGAFEVLLEWSIENLATNVRNAELTMVGSAALINAIITINTAAEVAIGPYISKIGERFNLNGYRRANILDGQTAALGYIFPWSGGVLAGYSAMQNLPGEYDWFDQSMVVTPIDVVPFVFQGWLLVSVFVLAALTGFGREYVIDRESEEVARV